MIKYTTYIILVIFYMTSCNSWLDVRPDTEQKDHDQFSTVDGFFDALIGCYMSLASTSLYGERLTMSNIESLANLWYLSSSTNRQADADLAKHNYTSDNSRSVIETIYGGLYKTIAQASVIIKFVKEQGDVFDSDTLRKVVEGEAYAIRALCHFDILRLFGQVPQNAQQQVMLPYSYTTSIEEMPAYYGFNDYVDLLEKDLDKAEELLRECDPIQKFTFEELNNSNMSVADEHLLYRQSRLNYWAVKALRARMLLYLGKSKEAYQVAKEIIDAQGVDGTPLMELSGVEDLEEGYNALPHECLFYLSQPNLHDNAIYFFIGGEVGIVFTDNELVITPEMYTELYWDVASYSGFNRRNLLWGNVESAVRKRYNSLKKYWWNDNNSTGGTVEQLTHQLIPILRMSEMYLIAMECAPSLDEANALYSVYMEDHGVSPTLLQPLENMEELKTFLLNEYRREFYGEGVMFYVYKRLNADEILWYDGEVSEKTYILPLPETEYNPNK